MPDEVNERKPTQNGLVAIGNELPDLPGGPVLGCVFVRRPGWASILYPPSTCLFAPFWKLLVIPVRETALLFEIRFVAIIGVVAVDVSNDIDVRYNEA